MKLNFLRAAVASFVCTIFMPTGGALAVENCRNTGSFSAWLSDFKKEAAQSGISSRTMRAVSSYLTYSPRIIKIDRGQRIFALDFMTFSKRVIPKYRLQKGRQLIKKHARLFSRIEREFGVPPHVLVALWGLESDFGAVTGKDKTLPALATLAYDCRRPDLFRRQLHAALKIVQRGDLRPSDMIGAWAGELGQTQFLPEHYVEHGVDYDGDGRVNLLRSKSDVMASTAAYLKHIGWRAGEPWLEEVRLPQNFAWQDADTTIEHPRSYWAAKGVKRANGKSVPSDDLAASIVIPVGRFGPAFMVYPNYRVFLEWNNSLVYSTSAAFFAQRLKGAGPYRARNRSSLRIFSGDEVKRVQRALVRRGLDVGKIDGIIGQKTRTAIKTMQLKFGLPSDSYPSDALMRRLN